MALTRRAVIDVGTNSIKLLVADAEGHQVRPVWEESKQTRLGQGFYRTHRLQPGAMEQTARAVAAFAAAARERQAKSIRVIATSAARDAVNGHELTAAIQQAAGLPVEIISGEREADLAFQGVTTDPALARAPLLLLDVGGGSTEFILGQGDQKHFRASFPLGSVRLIETIPHSDPPTVEEFAACRKSVSDFLQQEVEPKLRPAILRESSRGALRLVGTGGTATILARMETQMEGYERERIEATRLSRMRVQWHAEHLWGLPLARRQQVIGLPKNRADVILAGTVIYEAVMTRLDFAELRISTRGLRFAAVMEDG
jgi:exopolyphosphatase/guanosine-5'-triphosphate,3'-diphosphate pyrophosphatase